MRCRIAAVIALALMSICGVGIDSAYADKFQSVMRTAAVPPSDFLPSHSLLKRQSDDFPFHYFYRAGALDQYKNVYIAPVSLKHLRENSGWSALDHKLNGKLGTDMNEIAAFMRKAYLQAFENSQASPLKVQDRKDLPNTLVVETAIVAMMPSKAELQAAGVVGTFFIPLVGVATSAASAGYITVECIVRDAKTGKVVAMYNDTERDPDAVLAIAKLNWTRSARINIKTIAKYTVELLYARDYTKIKRSFPIKLTSLFRDADLDD